MAQAMQTHKPTVTGIIDGDGHFYEHDEALYPFFDQKKYTKERLGNYYLFPDLDGFRRAGFGECGDDARGWLNFLDSCQIHSTIIYPTAGLAYAFIRDTEWAIDLARAYNNFMSETYTKVSPRLMASALLPVQDPQAAAVELRRAVTELGLVGGILPAPGLLRSYGDPSFDVLYKEAQSLGTMLGVHGASYKELGLDFPQTSVGPFGHAGFRFAHPAQPLTQMIQFMNMICSGVWERFPDLKVAFLETGCGWVPYWVERIDGRAKKPIATNQLKNSPIYFHTELDELEGLRWFTSLYGNDRITWASDYPHGVTVEEISGEIEEFVESDKLPQDTKERVLRDNTKALYGLK